VDDNKGDVEMVSIGVCEHHEMVREALVKTIAQMRDMKVTVAENTVENFVNGVARAKPDVLVIDLAQPNNSGIDCIQKVAKVHGNGKVVALADDEDDETLITAYDAGAKALIGKARPIRDLHRTILDVATRPTAIEPAQVLQARRRLKMSGLASVTGIDATDRRMLQLLTLGWTDRQIADDVCLSLQSVRNRMSRLLNKFGMSNRTQLALHSAASNGKNGAANLADGIHIPRHERTVNA
jgi:DNA-binding NarL/FixJ family response regulator